MAASIPKGWKDMKSGLAQAIKGGQVLLGSFHDFADQDLIELVGHAGFDFVALEWEHGLRDMTTIQLAIRASEGAGMYTLIRIGESDEGLIGKLLDGGADGVIVADVRNAEDAARIVRAAKYPPLGVRGEGYARRGELWGLGPGNRAAQRRNNEEVAVIAIIENSEGVANIEEILQVDGITAVMPGPGDLALSLGVSMEADKVRVLVEQVQDAVLRSDKKLMCFVRDPEAAFPLVQRGCTMLLHGHDALLIGDLYRRLAHETRKVVVRGQSAKKRTRPQRRV
jgi:2-keto-3-deoxy-L-rhamnonate aldolase RhmA